MQRRLSGIFLSALVAVCFIPVAIADPATPVSMVIVDNPDPVASGQEITYTITMQNTGGARVDSVVFSDQLNGVGGIGVPPQLQITSTRGSCSQSTTLVTCSAGTIEGRGVWIVTIRGIVTAANGTVVNNTATVAGTKSAQNFNTTLTETTQVVGGSGSPLPDLTMSKTGPTSVLASSPMVYTLTINNQGTAPATDITVVDTVPAGVSIVDVVTTSLFTCSVGADLRTVTCVGGRVNQGTNATITINALAPMSTGIITNTAVVDPDNLIVEGNELNNTSALVNTQVTTEVTTALLTLEHTDDSAVIMGAGPDPVTPAQLLTYKTFVTNPSPIRADDVEIVIGTQGLVASSIVANQIITDGTVGNNGGCWVTASETRCRARTLNDGGTILMTVTGSVIASAGSTIISTATVTGNIRNNGVKATDTELTTVKPQFDLTVTKSDAPDPVCASSWPTAAPPASPPLLGPAVCLGGLTYTFVVGNSGIVDATNVTLRDPLPAGTVLDSFTVPMGSGFACSVNASNVFTCTGGTVPAESTLTITAVLVAPPGTGTVLNTATVDPNNAIFEADETNNTGSASTLVVSGIDLTVLKEDVTPGFDPIATSGTQTYTITVDNLGPQNASNIRVRDTLPSGTIFRDVVADNGFTCSHSNGVVECFGGSLLGTAAEFYPPFGAPGNDTATIVIRIFAQSFEGTMHNEVRVDPLNEIAEINENNNFEFEDTDVTSGGAGQGAFNQFTIAKIQQSPDPTNTARNAPVTYIITVGNDGTDPATGVTVRDFLPAGSSYIEATGTNQFECSQVGGHIDCVGGELAAGGNATITIKAFAPDTPGTYVNQAIVDPDNTKPEGNEFDNAASATTVVKNAGAGAFYELSITKTQAPGNPIARNGVVTYTITATNSGTDTATGVTIRDTLPAGSRYILATATSNNQFLCSHAGGVVECVGGRIGGTTTLPNTATIDVKIFVPDTPGTYTNQALVDPDNTVPEGDEENNRASFDTVVEDGATNGLFNDLSIDKTGTTAITPGGAIIWTLTVTNNGSDAAQNVSVRDVLPTGVVFISATDNAPGAAFQCSESGGVISCSGATVGAGGATRSITIEATAPQTNRTIRNVATVDPNNTIPEGNESNNSDFLDTVVASDINLTVTKSGPTVATQSSVTDYSIAVTNNAVSGSGQFATGVVMHDALPVGLIPLAVDAGTGNNWNCTINENPINLVTCLGDLPTGDTVTVKITVFITAESGRSLDNVACVDPANTITESNELDNCSEVSTFVAPEQPARPDLLMSKQVDKLSTTPGDSLEYTLTISNVGTDTAKGWDGMTGITITDDLDANLTFNSVTATNGFVCTELAGTVTCHDDGSGMTVGEFAQITILASVNENATASVPNTASAAPALNANAACDPLVCGDETVTDNNDSSVLTSIGSSGFDLVLGSVTDNPDPVSPGQGLNYTVIALNAGTATASPVKVRIDIPSAGVMHLGSAASNGFNCAAPVGTVIDCTGSLPAGGDTMITLNFIALGAPPPSVNLTATVDPDNDFTETDEGNNSETEPTSISGAACSACVDLVAALLTASPEPATAGGPLSLTFWVVNVGDQPTSFNPMMDRLLSLDLITDGVLTSVAPVSSDPMNFPCFATFDPMIPVLLQTSCRGNLAPNQGVMVTLNITATGTFITAVGTADPDDLIPTEFNEGNNQLIESVVVNP